MLLDQDLENLFMIAHHLYFRVKKASYWLLDIFVKFTLVFKLLRTLSEASSFDNPYWYKSSVTAFQVSKGQEFYCCLNCLCNILFFLSYS